MKKYFSILIMCFIGFGANAQTESTAIPFPATCMVVNDQVTPDENGNLVFFPSQHCTIENYHFQIFDRFGTLVFETKDLNEAWKPNGDIATGVYFWKITGQLATAPTTLESKGNVTLIR